jgi:Leucine-rich repeat (LRR) protein
MQSIDCKNNQLTYLNINDCIVLKELDCINNNLTDIDFSHCINIVNVLYDENNVNIINNEAKKKVDIIDELDVRPFIYFNRLDHPKRSLLENDAVFGGCLVTVFEKPIKDIISGDFCQDINSYYVRSSINEKENAIVYIASPNKIYSFACVKFTDYNSMFIDIICSNNTIHVKGSGKYLINFLEDIAKKVFKVSRIELEAVINVIPFYEKLDYIKKKKNLDQWLMEKRT